jgi:hypothetical protein
MIPCSYEFCNQLRLSINGLIFERDLIQRWVKLSAKFGDLLPDVLGEMSQLRIASGYKDVKKFALALLPEGKIGSRCTTYLIASFAPILFSWC